MADIKKADGPRKKKVYILSEEMRASKSGFFIEGTDIAMDFPDRYPLPLQSEIIEDGRPVSLRVLPFCESIVLAEQLGKGFPMTYNYTESDRDKLTFIYGRLELDEQRDRIWWEYIERQGWMKGNEEKKRYGSTKTIYQSYDEEKEVKEEVDETEVIVKAQNAVFGLTPDKVRDLYKLSQGGNFIENSISVMHMKKHLLNVAAVNPQFITDGIRKGRDEIIVLLNKAQEYKILTMDVDGMVGLKITSDEDFDPFFEIGEGGGRENKFERAVDYLNAEDNKAYLIQLKEKIKNHEEKLVE